MLPTSSGSGTSEAEGNAKKAKKEATQEGIDVLGKFASFSDNFWWVVLLGASSEVRTDVSLECITCIAEAQKVVDAFL